MTYVREELVELTTSAGGAATGYTPPLTGKISHIRYVADGSTPYDNTVDFTITAERSGLNIWTESNITASKTCVPRQDTHGTNGAASLYAAGGTAVQDKIAIAEDRVKIVLAQGGATKTGKFYVVME